ncbi:MAG: DUF2007 domain-containing protein [Planctomycetes bacterium]|nr:DUF2007 domain-containing protein [Planctomycetota bacterium]
MDDFITIAFFDKAINAHMARIQLESAGIRCFIEDEFTVNANWLYWNTIGGVKLNVARQDAEKAALILSPKIHPAESANKKTIQCPICNSGDVSEKSKACLIMLVMLILTGVLLPLFPVKRKMRCNACRHQWEIDRKGLNFLPK